MDPKTKQEVEVVRLTVPAFEMSHFDAGFRLGRETMHRDAVELMARKMEEAQQAIGMLNQQMKETDNIHLLRQIRQQKRRWALAHRVCAALHAEVSMLDQQP